MTLIINPLSFVHDQPTQKVVLLNEKRFVLKIYKKNMFLHFFTSSIDGKIEKVTYVIIDSVTTIHH